MPSQFDSDDTFGSDGTFTFFPGSVKILEPDRNPEGNIVVPFPYLGTMAHDIFGFRHRWPGLPNVI